MPTIRFSGFAGAEPSEIVGKTYNGAIATTGPDGKPGIPFQIKDLEAGSFLDVPLEVSDYLVETFRAAGPHKGQAFTVTKK